MRLSKIKLSGFKSFVDPTTVKFPSNLMGVVGPNGCGKSNIIDAVRWVLGETSAKTLRGDSMADVIFNGSSTRKPVGQAMIELTFDNSDGAVGGAYAGYSEVSVRRVVSRDGTSQYFLNNTRCRRKDITHILLGTGLGSHGYSIIEQGMISRLVEAKPEELRAFLEEAAGISKYKERRRETEHRIRHTRENLERLCDLRDEVEKQLGHLQRQARAASRYKELKVEQRRVHAELLALRLRALRAEAAQQESRLKDKQLALDAALAEQRALEAEIERLRVTLHERNELFNEVQGSYYRIGAEIARLEQSIQHRKDLTERQRQDLAATDEQLEEIRRHITNDQIELQQLDLVLNELSPDLERAHASQRASQDALEQAERAMEQWREAWDGAARELAETERVVEVERARIEQLSAQHERLERELRKSEAERVELSSTELEQRLEELVANEQTLDAGCGDAARAVDTVTHQIRQLREQDQRLVAQLDQLRGRLQADRGRLVSLEALQEAALGLASGKSSAQVAAWLESRSLGSTERLGQRLSVEPGWERAVETVLGAYLQAVGVEDIGALADGLGELTEGGLTLLEHGAVASQPRSEDRSWLQDRVRSPASVAPLLRGVHAAESLDAAMAMRPTLEDGESVVTRDGFWLGRHWLRIHRSDDPQVGVLARAEEIKRLQADIAQSAARVEKLDEALADTRARLGQLEETRGKWQAEANQRQQAHAETRTRLESCRAELAQLRQRRTSLDRVTEELRADLESVGASLRDSRERLDTATAHRERLLADREQLEQQRAPQQQRLQEARARAEHDREAAQEIAIKMESRRSSKESASAALARVQAQQQHLLRRRRELEDQISAANAPLDEEQQLLEAKLDERLAVESELGEARRAMEETDTQLREVQHRRSEREQTVSAAREEMDVARLGVREAQVRAETVGEQLAETGFDVDTLFAEMAEDATVEVWQESVERLERRIQRLGPINLAAIDEFQEQTQRKEYLDAQYKDLSDALETLENAIRKIDRETRARFKETFDKANQGLGRLFPRLFGGGNAYLELDGDDLLSSGVAVMARPPGKRISNIHLLSGGEKALTAVALVFSIFELNPAPFCLLDEVDAPLDDANVGRFSEIVREMAEQVQFIIITHNKTTMEAMHQLTGVTMHEPGVSRLVAVDIDEAVQLAAM